MIRERADVKPEILRAKLPGYMAQGLEDYLFDRVPPGGFLLAVLENDLKQAALRADSANSIALWKWGVFMWNQVRYDCQGSEEIVAKWLFGDDGDDGDDNG